MKFAALNLPIAKKWFDMITSGKKCEEYRDATNRQCARLYNEAGRNGGVLPDGLAAIFRNGYRPDSPALIVAIEGLTVRGRGEIKHPQWGEPESPRFVIKLGVVVSDGSYSEIKSKILKAKGVSGQ